MVVRRVTPDESNFPLGRVSSSPLSMLDGRGSELEQARVIQKGHWSKDAEEPTPVADKKDEQPAPEDETKEEVSDSETQCQG